MKILCAGIYYCYSFDTCEEAESFISKHQNDDEFILDSFPKCFAEIGNVKWTVRVLKRYKDYPKAWGWYK